MKGANLILFGLCLACFTACTRYSYIPRQKNHFENNPKTEKTGSELVKNGQKLISYDSIDIRPNKIKAFLNNSNSSYVNLDREEIENNSIFFNYIKTAPNPKSILVFNKIFKERELFDSMKATKNNKKFSTISTISGVFALLDFYLLIEFFYNSILSIYLPITLIFGIITLIISAIALTKTRNFKEQYRNRYMAKVGLIVGLLTIILVIVGFILIFLAIASL